MCCMLDLLCLSLSRSLCVFITLLPCRNQKALKRPSNSPHFIQLNFHGIFLNWRGLLGVKWNVFEGIIEVDLLPPQILSLYPFMDTTEPWTDQSRLLSLHKTQKTHCQCPGAKFHRTPSEVSCPSTSWQVGWLESNLGWGWLMGTFNLLPLYSTNIPFLWHVLAMMQGAAFTNQLLHLMNV